MRALALAVTVAALPLGGCAHHVALSSTPPGAAVTLGGVPVGVTPMDLSVPFVGARRLHVEFTGYRALDVKLALFPARAMELRLVREHGPAGTWDAEDVR